MEMPFFIFSPLTNQRNSTYRRITPKPQHISELYQIT